MINMFIPKLLVRMFYYSNRNISKTILFLLFNSSSREAKFPLPSDNQSEDNSPALSYTQFTIY